MLELIVKVRPFLLNTTVNVETSMIPAQYMKTIPPLYKKLNPHETNDK